MYPSPNLFPYPVSFFSSPAEVAKNVFTAAGGENLPMRLTPGFKAFQCYSMQARLKKGLKGVNKGG